MASPESHSVPLTVGPQGRVVIPYKFRRQLGIEPGTRMVSRVENGQLVFETQDQIIQRLQDLVCSKVPADVSLADELIAERRADAAREMGLEMGANPTESEN